MCGSYLMGVKKYDYLLVNLKFFLYMTIMGGNMGRYVTVSVKVPIEVKEKLEKLGIKPSKLLKRAIDEELRRREIEEIEDKLKELENVLNRFSREFIVESIREDRESR